MDPVRSVRTSHEARCTRHQRSSNGNREGLDDGDAFDEVNLLRRLAFVDYRNDLLHVKSARGQAIGVNEIWGLSFSYDGMNNANGKLNELFFTGGPNNCADGLFGVMTSG